MSDAKSDWITQLRTALAWAERFPHARMGIETRPILDAARLLASGRQPDRNAIADAIDDAVFEHFQVSASADAISDMTEAVVAALGGSDVLIVDITTDTDFD